MKTLEIKELENLFDKEQKNLNELKERIRKQELSIKEQKNESIWTDFEVSIKIIGCLIGFLIGILFLFGGKDSLIISVPLILVCGGFSSFGFYLEYNLNKRIKESESLYTELKGILKENEDKIQKIENKLNQNKGDRLESLRIDFIKDLDSDGDKTIDVIQHDNEFMKILKSNQKMILKMEKSENRDFTKQFVKLSNFLVDKEKNLQSVFQRISDIDKLERFDTFKSNLIQQIQFYNVLRLNSLQMISTFIDDDRITFYLIYEKFDKLGVWNTHFENQFLLKMDLLNSNIERLLSEIHVMRDDINYSINELISITDQNTLSLSNKLNEVGSKIDVTNMLNTINTYQNYRTNKSLK